MFSVILCYFSVVEHFLVIHWTSLLIFLRPNHNSSGDLCHQGFLVLFREDMTKCWFHCYKYPIRCTAKKEHKVNYTKGLHAAGAQLFERWLALTQVWCLNPCSCFRFCRDELSCTFGINKCFTLKVWTVFRKNRKFGVWIILTNLWTTGPMKSLNSLSWGISL